MSLDNPARGKVVACAKPASSLSAAVQILLTLIGVTLSSGVCLWVFYAFATGRNLKQRLTEPDAIVTEMDAAAIAAAKPATT